MSTEHSQYTPFSDVAPTFYSGMQQQIQEHFHTTDFVATLGVGLFNFGSIFGPLIGGPLSELYGRRPVYIGASVGFVFFTLAAALSPTMVSLLGCRALAGLIGSAVFAIYGGSLADLFNPDERGSLVALFTVVLQGAPTIGPVPSSLLGAIVHWRWLMACIAIWATIVTAVVICLPETEVNAIRRRIAREQGSGARKGCIPDQPSVIWRDALLTPITMLRCEPIVTWTTLYHAFVYGLLFLLLEGYPHVYKSHYSMSRQHANLVFIAPCLGNLLGVLIYFRVLKPQYEAHRHAIFVQSRGKKEIPPEGRLPGVSLSSLFTPIGMFWFAFSAHPDIHWLVPALSGVPVGIGMTLVQLSLFNYYMDLYPTRSASVIAANCAVRNVVSTIFPSLGAPLYSHFGIRNASLLLACISCIGFPMALILLFYGRNLRAASRWAKQDVIDVSDSAPCFDAVAPLMSQLPQPTYGGTGSSD
ncbi:major facilitator superfamily domain-containing protein [Butyriboletus roseoflavus]|nr:major facilitator superfamily domain-containing protein [Butyriboletus roseoflavus]